MATATIVVVITFLVWHAVAYARAVPAAGKHEPAGDPIPDVSVTFLVAAWTAEAEVEPFVLAFRALSLRRKQLVLCIGGRDDGLELARHLAGDDVSVIEQRPGDGKQGGLRRGIPLASGEYIYLTDIDCRPDDASVRPMVAALASADAAAVTGSIRPLDTQIGDAFVDALWAIERFGVASYGQTVSGLRGANALVRRPALGLAGDFRQEAPSGTDYTLAKELRASGMRIGFVRSSEMPVRFPPNPATYMRKQARWLRNVAVLAPRYGAWSELWGVVQTMTLPFLVVALAAAGFVWWPAWAAAATLLLHAMLNRARYAKCARVHVPAAGIIISVLADLGAGVLAAKQAVFRTMAWS